MTLKKSCRAGMSVRSTERPCVAPMLSMTTLCPPSGAGSGRQAPAPTAVTTARSNALQQCPPTSRFISPGYDAVTPCLAISLRDPICQVNRVGPALFAQDLVHRLALGELVDELVQVANVPRGL